MSFCGCHCSLQPLGSINQTRQLELVKLPKNQLAVDLKNTHYLSRDMSWRSHCLEKEKETEKTNCYNNVMGACNFPDSFFPNLF